MSDTGILPGKWTHVAMAIDPGGWDVTFYINGEQAGRGELAYRPLASLDTITFGALQMWRSSNLDVVIEHHFKGQLNEVQVWDKALTQSEVRQYATDPPQGDESNLIGLWLFDGDLADSIEGGTNHAEIKPKVLQSTSYQYYRWVITEIRDINDIEAVGVQASQFQFYKDGIPQVMTAPAITVTGLGNPAWNETVDMLVDYDLNTKWLNMDMIEGEYPSFAYSGNHAVVTFELENVKAFNGYRWATAPFGWSEPFSENARDPKTWRIEASNDGENWTLLHSVENYNATEARSTWQNMWEILE